MTHPPSHAGYAPARARTPRARATAQAALEGALQELGSRVRRGAPPRDPLPPRPTGLPGLDRLLGGGFPRGGLSEIVGPASSGRTSLALALLARTTDEGEVTAVVDWADAFDPPSAEAAGVDLDRVLWVRAPGWKESLRSVHQLLRAGGFGVVLLDWARWKHGARWKRGARSERRPLPAARVWPRLRRELAATETALVLLGESRVAHTFADLALEMDPARARFAEGGPGLAGAFLEGLEGAALLARSRIGEADRRAQAHWPAHAVRSAPAA